jgi:hypothetical protein
VVNFDNCCNDIAAYLPTSATGAYHACYWTGVTLKRMTRPSIDLSLVKEGRAVVPAMPDSLFENSLWTKLITYMKDVDQLGSRYLCDAAVTTLRINSFPPKPTIKDLQDMELDSEHMDELKELLSEESVDGLSNVFPKSLLDFNVGSNYGLMNVLMEVSKDNQSGSAHAARYQIYLTDMNIHHRINKVNVIYFHFHSCVGENVSGVGDLQDTSKILPPHLHTRANMFVQMLYTEKQTSWTKNMRTHVASVLGFWHSFKMANHLVYRKFAFLFFAPAFHHITPGHNFFIKPSRLIQVQEWLTLFRLSFDEDVKKAIKDAEADKRMNSFSRSILREYKDLCRFFIPAVRV